jgi:hypothetical protein
MPGTPALLKIIIDADATKAVAGMKDATTAASGISGSLKTVGKVIGPALGVGAVVGFGKASVTAAQESAVATARLDQIFQSMGDSTGEASKAAQTYASALSAKTGVEDESIMAGQAQLATFGEVSSESARMAGIFDRATAAGADLAAAGFGSIDSNAVQLGKALQDPAKGMTALAKSGVTFTDAQKDQIKAMQESGDLLGAQKILLGAVETQVGGTAEATATSTGKMSLKFGELQEQVGGKLLPVISVMADIFTKYMDVLLPLAGVILAVVAAYKAWTIIQGIMNILQTEGNVITALWNALLLANPIVLIVIAIAAVIAILILLYFKVGWFRDLVDAAFRFVADAFGWIVDAAKAVFDWVKNNWPLLLAILTGPFGIAVLLITKNWDTIKDAAKAVVDWVTDKFTDLSGFFSRIASTIGSVLGDIANSIRYPIDAATQAVQWVIDKFNSLVDFFKGLIESVRNTIGDVAGAIKDPLNAVIRAWNNIEFGIPGIDVGPVHWAGFTVGTPNIPELAKGGMVMRSGLALVHEGEQFSGVGKSFSKGQTINITVNTTGLGADAPQIQRAVVHALRGYTARNGPLQVPVAGIA